MRKVMIGCLLVIALLPAAASGAVTCYSCGGEYGCQEPIGNRTDCLAVWANGRWECRYSGGFCASGGNPKPTPMRTTPSREARRITSVVFVAVPAEVQRALFGDASVPTLIPSDITTRGVLTEQIASHTGLDQSAVRVVSAITFYSNDTPMPVLGIGSDTHLGLEIQPLDETKISAAISLDGVVGLVHHVTFDGDREAALLPFRDGHTDYALAVITDRTGDKQRLREFRKRLAQAPQALGQQMEISGGEAALPQSTWGGIKSVYR